MRLLTRAGRVRALARLAKRLDAYAGPDLADEVKRAHEIGVLIARADDIAERLERTTELDAIKAETQKLEELKAEFARGPIRMVTRSTPNAKTGAKPS